MNTYKKCAYAVTAVAAVLVSGICFSALARTRPRSAETGNQKAQTLVVPSGAVNEFSKKPEVATTTQSAAVNVRNATTTPQPAARNDDKPAQTAPLIPKAEAAPEPSAQTPDPVTLKIHSIGLAAPVVKTGLEADGALHVPSSPDLAGWYTLGPKPGEIGPAVITGHFDSKAGPGIFYNLRRVKPGDEISVIRNDGTIAVFTVDKLEYYPQNNFNTQAVYGPISMAGLRIITCAGSYNRTARRYSDNLVVYATLKTVTQPGAYQPL